MKPLLTAYRVADLDRSAGFYAKPGYAEIGRVEFEDGTVRQMLNLPVDGATVRLELVYEPRIGPLEIGNGFRHLAVQADHLDAFRSRLSATGIAFDGPHLHGGEDGTKTAFDFDPDG